MDLYTSGNWHVKPGRERDFVQMWEEFLRGARKSQPGLGTAWLMRDEKDESHFVSFADWHDESARDAWQETPDFERILSELRAMCDEVYVGGYKTEVVV